MKNEAKNIWGELCILWKGILYFWYYPGWGMKKLMVYYFG